MTPLELLIQQLWSPGLSDGVRITTPPRQEPAIDPSADLPWRDAERYWLLPGRTSPRLLLPDAPKPVLRAAITHYRGLRRLPANLARQALGVAAGAGVPMSRDRLTVQVRSDADAATLPLACIARELERPRLWATFGVRTGANRKATMQLLDERGTSVGYAKLGWNATADDYVSTEARALREVGGGQGLMRAPRLLASFAQGERPVVVMEPLPAGVRGVRGAQQSPSSAELFDLCPVERRARTGSTAHLRAHARRLDRLGSSGAGADVVSRATALVRRLEEDRRIVPVQARWHGDLTPWNCAREPDGQLWAWDWESCESDVVAGLDAVHWEFSVLREAGSLDDITLAACLERARRHLTAAGHEPATRSLVAAVYALTVAERAATLAAREGGWERVWITPAQVLRLLAEAERLAY